MSILDYWPWSDRQPRPQQVEALRWVEKQTARFLVMELPTGFGKSAFGLTVARWMNAENSNNGSFVLVPQRQLQQQYTNDFADHVLASLYGKSNYTCNSRNTTCDVGSLVKPSCGKQCPHSTAKRNAKSTPNVVLNYKLALLSFSYTTTFNPRKLMILDECHNAEQELCEFDVVEIFQKRCEKYNIQYNPGNTIEHAQAWMVEVYLPAIELRLDALAEECEDLMDRSDLTPHEISKIRELNSLSEHVNAVSRVGSMQTAELRRHFVLEVEKTNIRFKRLFGAHSFNEILNPMAERFLFMSATIPNARNYCRDLGIPWEDVAYLTVPSDFPVENRPIVFWPQMKMNASWMQPENDRARNDLRDTIIEICEHHKNDSGIVHSGNFQISKWLVEQLQDQIPHDIVHHNPDSGDDRNKILSMFQKKKTRPTLLISPSITEGLDLRDDLARFAIIAKVPYGNLGSAWIRRRMELSPEWYQRQAITDIIQGCGRVVRSRTDHGVTYLLDSNWSMLYSKAHHMIPQWWKDAYEVKR